MKQKVLLFSAFVLLFAGIVRGQIFTPVKWNVKLETVDDARGVVVMSASIDDGWHMYSDKVDPDVGPTPLSVSWNKLEGVKLDGPMTPAKAPHSQFDEMFEATLSWWTGGIVIKQPVKFTGGKYTIDGDIRFSACNDENCIPPSREPFSFSGTAAVGGKAADTAEAVEEETAQEETAADTAAVAISQDDAVATVSGDQLWEPVTFDEDNAGDDAGSKSMWYVFITCFIGGFVALLTPCVWPIIPMTVSFFLKKNSSRAKSIRDAIIYGVSIIVIYLALGLIITSIFGASSLNALSTSAVCNIIFFLLLVVFAISFFGAFDITLPSKWTNKMDEATERTTGLLSIFFMAFTLTLVSFSCTGPIIGTLLVEAASTGDKFGPALGMFGFSLALAIPFCLFAMFPSWLQTMPKSGSWMASVKVVLGFLELALSLKFLSVADLAYGWHILDRETFLALWIVIFGLLGLYLLGKFNFAHYGDADGKVGTVRFFLAMISLSFSVYLLPGLWGAPLKSVSAFVPPLYTQDFDLYGNHFQEYDDYDLGMKAAAGEKKPVLIDFSGYGCVNCRKMEGAVLDESSIHSMIEENFTVIKLMVDEKKDLPEPMVVTENGKRVTLRTYGDRWSYLQRYKFHANAQPYYVILDNEGNLLSGPFSYEEDIPGFKAFLQKGINRYQNKETK